MYDVLKYLDTYESYWYLHDCMLPVKISNVYLFAFQVWCLISSSEHIFSDSHSLSYWILLWELWL